jgi:hypothetical protein
MNISKMYRLPVAQLLIEVNRRATFCTSHCPPNLKMSETPTVVLLSVRSPVGAMDVPSTKVGVTESTASRRPRRPSGSPP